MPAKIESIIALAKLGASDAEIARELNTPLPVVRKQIGRHRAEVQCAAAESIADVLRVAYAEAIGGHVGAARMILDRLDSRRGRGRRKRRQV